MVTQFMNLLAIKASRDLFHGLALQVGHKARNLTKLKNQKPECFGNIEISEASGFIIPMTN
jgi:hypothetical protein